MQRWIDAFVFEQGFQCQVILVVRKIKNPEIDVGAVGTSPWMVRSGNESYMDGRC